MEEAKGSLPRADNKKNGAAGDFNAMSKYGGGVGGGGSFNNANQQEWLDINYTSILAKFAN